MERRISGQIADEAAFWDARLRSPGCTDVDRTLFAEWRDASPDHRAAFERLQTIFLSLRHNMARADVRALRDAALRIEKPHTTRRRVFAAVAAVAGVAVIAALWTRVPEHFRQAPLSELAAIAENWIGSQPAEIYETGTGQRSTRTLQDGSSVELNARTRIKVVFNERTRTVELVYGQALFHVTHNARRPFIVRAADRDITAIGTQFDVRLDATSVRVTLIEGKVKVSRESSASGDETAPQDQPHSSASEKTPGPAFHIPSDPATSPANAVYLTPGQQLIARLTPADERAGGSDSLDAGTSEGTALVRTVDIAKVTGWHDGRIFLEDLTLADAVAEMNRHSPVQINIQDSRLAGFRVNGMFRAGEQEAFVTALEQYFPIAVQHRGDTEIILTLRQ